MNLPWAAAASLVSLLIQRSTFFVIALLAAGPLGTAELGKFALAYSFCVNIGQIVSEPLAIAVGVLGGPKRATVRSQILRASILGSTVVALATVATAPFLSTAGGGGLESAYRISAFVLLFQIPASVLAALLYAIGIQIPVAVVLSVTSLAIMAVCALVVRYAGSDALVTVLGAGSAIQFLLLVWLLPTRMRRLSLASFNCMDIPWRSIIFPTAGTIALQTPIHLLCLNLLAASRDGLHQVALFSTLYVFTSVFTFVPLGLRSIVLPRLSSDNKASKHTALRVLLAGTFAVGLLLLCVLQISSSAILSLMGAAFSDSEKLLLYICLIGLAMATVLATNYYMWAERLSSTTLVLTISYALCYLASCLYLVTVNGYGAEGLALALCSSMTLQVVMSATFLIRRYRG